MPSPLRSLLASTGPHSRPALLALATALTPGFDGSPPSHAGGGAEDRTHAVAAQARHVRGGRAGRFRVSWRPPALLATTAPPCHTKPRRALVRDRWSRLFRGERRGGFKRSQKGRRGEMERGRFRGGGADGGGGIGYRRCRNRAQRSGEYSVWGRVAGRVAAMIDSI